MLSRMSTGSYVAIGKEGFHTAGMVDNGKLAARIAAAREAMQPVPNQTQFAKRIGVSRAAVSTWEKKGEIKRTNLSKVARLTGRSVSEFTDDESPLDDLARIPPQNSHTNEETMEENVDSAALKDFIKLVERHGVRAVQSAYDRLMHGPAMQRQVKENP
jgi:transcriptional regulator with XRE-family HTH domain